LKIVVGADHGGFHLKEQLVSWLIEEGHEVEDVGAYRYDQDDDYPDFAIGAAKQIIDGNANRGIVICGSGVGASITANKVNGIRASVCHDSYSAAQGVEHDDMNILCIGARVIGYELAQLIVESFVASNYSGGIRHQRRLDKIMNLEK
jgi:ribose 5-phosphate isomerase B